MAKVGCTNNQVFQACYNLPTCSRKLHNRLWNICSTAHVQGEMVLPAKPADFQRFIVIVMVHLGLRTATYLARLFDDLAALQISLCVTAAVHLMPLDWVERMQLSPLSQILRVTLQAIGFQLSSNEPSRMTARTEEIHAPILRKHSSHCQ